MSTTRNLFRCLAPTLVVLLFAVMDHASIGLAATRSERTEAASELVQEALHREIYGQTAERSKLLGEARQQSPDFAPAMWHSGHVLLGSQWIKVTDVPERSGSDRRLDLYQQQRLKTGDTVAGHLALADWCRKMKLLDRERAHLSRVVAWDPNHAGARTRLGFRLVDGRWVDMGQVREATLEARDNAEAFREWAKRLEDIRRGFEGHRLHAQTAAERLRQIRDPSAVPAMEALLTTLGEPAAMASLEAFVGMDAHQADLALARLSVFSTWPAVQTAAIEALKQRPFENFVPDLLGGMVTPVQSQWQLYEGRGGRLMFRQVYTRETQDRTEQVVLETGYRRIAIPGGDRVDTLERALSDVLVTGATRGVSEVQQRLAVQQLNDRIVHVLAEVTNEQVDPEPQAWWTWWDEHNEVFRPDQKQVDNRYQYDEITLVDRAPVSGQGPGSGGGGSSGSSQRCDCLAAGTRLWTDTGPKAIEEMQVGDLVLAQDPETGELAYKPVLRFTIRPASHLVTLEAGGESITTSGGHLFWVAGEGWVRARDAKRGTELHSVDGTVQLRAVETARFEPSYNVIVADFHTYFVGEKQPVLCHDNTVRQKTDAVVPGLIDR